MKYGVMDTTNSHNAKLVEMINHLFEDENNKKSLSAILLALAQRDKKELEDRFDCDAPNTEDAAWDWAHNILQGVCDDWDLDVVIRFVRRGIDYNDYKYLYEEEPRKPESKKDYYTQMAKLKESIIGDIIALMQNRNRLVFDHSRDFRMAYLDYSYNPSAEVLALNIDGGKLIADIKWIAGDDDVESFSGKTLFTLDSLIALKSELMYYIRYEKLEKLRKLVESAGGNIKFDGSFKFIGKEQMADGSTSYFDDTELYGLSIKDGKLSIDDVWEGNPYDNDEDFIDTDSIDSLLEYVKAEVEKRKFTIKASRGMSRTFEIVADSYEKALEIAKAEMQKVPFYDGDIDWDEIA